MKKIDKKSIIYMLVLIIGITIGIYMFFTKENDNIEEIMIEETNITEQNNNIVVYITGCINNSGVYEMQEENRISDLIEKAGGFTKEADTNNINLAYKLEDEMKIYIPSKNETKNQLEEKTNYQQDNEAYISRGKSDLETKEYNNNTNKMQKININTATQTELETLPGIGASTALKIIEYRKEKGKFKSIEDIKNIKGIGENKYNKIKELIKI
ncbi:MAG: DUF655 domain-containing protein [Clostridia bacterium]|nr:DUF655 domain-containing protein [Clostridia bacterium]